MDEWGGCYTTTTCNALSTNGYRSLIYNAVVLLLRVNTTHSTRRTIISLLVEIRWTAIGYSDTRGALDQSDWSINTTRWVIRKHLRITFNRFGIDSQP